MIVVFVVDTSSSMSTKLGGSCNNALSRLDLAKMAMESISKGLIRRIQEHNHNYHQQSLQHSQQQLLQQQQQQQKGSFTSTPSSFSVLQSMGLGSTCPSDIYLLLRTTPSATKSTTITLDTASKNSIHPESDCGASGRLLVGFGEYSSLTMDGSDKPATGSTASNSSSGSSNQGGGDYSSNNPNVHMAFERELKQLRVDLSTSTSASPSEVSRKNMTEAISAGLALMSRYRFQKRSTENFGMGRLPSPAMLVPSGGALATHALQPACMILFTDGECWKDNHVTAPILELSGITTPLREFYQEPFRWDQRIFIVTIRNDLSNSSPQVLLPPSILSLCEITGGCQTTIRSASSISSWADQMLKILAPPRPCHIPIADPLHLSTSTTNPSPPNNWNLPAGTFVQGGPICCFQALEAGTQGEPSPLHRAMILNVPFQQQVISTTGIPPNPSPPTWCIPEAFFPSPNLDTLPPRLAQPLLTFSRNYTAINSPTFDPLVVIKTLHHLEHLIMLNRKLLTPNQQQPGKLLLRDVYICEWISPDGKPALPPSPGRTEYTPVAVRGAGRSISEGEEPVLNIGILHVPTIATSNPSSLIYANSLSAKNSISRSSSGGSSNTYSTLTLLPPEPHILLPLLLKAADAEHRMLKKYPDKPRAVYLDDSWRSEFRAYLFRIPPYYQSALNRCLRPLLPPSLHSLVSNEGIEKLASQCFSKLCLQKIRSGEQTQKEANERMERQERELRRRGVSRVGNDSSTTGSFGHIGYGQYDPRGTTSSYLAALRTLPPPWKGRRGLPPEGTPSKSKLVDSSVLVQPGSRTCATFKPRNEKPANETLADLPSDCLVPYYESRRRWIFGGTGLTTRNVFVDGVSNDGSNSQRFRANSKPEDESLLAMAGVGVSTFNKMPTYKMGDYRERLLWTRAPIVGVGSSDCHGVAGTTAPDGSPLWSVDDNVMPLSFFDPKTGEFVDSVQARLRSKLTVHFGNPFKDKRGDSLIPEAFIHQQAPRRRAGSMLDDSTPMTPPGSPPQDSFLASEGEGEALFATPPRYSMSQSSESKPPTPPPIMRNKKRDSSDIAVTMSEPKRGKVEALEMLEEKKSPEKRVDGPLKPRPPPPPTVSGNVTRPPIPPIPPPKKAGNPPPPKLRPPPPPPPPAVTPGGTVVKPKPPLNRSSAPALPKGGPISGRSLIPSKEHPPVRAVNPPLSPIVSESPSATVATESNPVTAAATVRPLPKPMVVMYSSKSDAVGPTISSATTSITTGATTAAGDGGISAEIQSPDRKPNVELPPDWIVSWSRSQQRWYYFNKKTNKSVWEWPPPT
jgi:WW domain